MNAALHWLGAPFRGVGHMLGTAFHLLLDPEGRKGWALFLLAGNSVVMTVIVSVVLYLVRDYPKLAFWLGVGGYLLIAIVTTGLVSLIGVRRDADLSAGPVRIKFSDQEAQAIADKVANAIPAPPPPPAPVIVQTGSPPTGQGGNNP